MPSFTVALLQMAGCGLDQRASLEKGDRFCREAAAMGADLALFPEMWNIGYTIPEEGAGEVSLREWRAAAITVDSAFHRHFQHLAVELGMAVALTYLERWPGRPRNSVSVIDRKGGIALNYAKVHTCAFSREAHLTPGTAFPVAPVDTRAGPVSVGAMICFDREFPESARTLMLGGAEIILTPNACDLEANRLGQFRARAFENMVGVAMANYAAPDQNGHSVAYDGMAFSSDERSRETCLVEAGEDEGVFLATFDLGALRDYREREVWGPKYRRPETYKPLTGAGRPT